MHHVSRELYDLIAIPNISWPASESAQRYMRGGKSNQNFDIAQDSLIV